MSDNVISITNINRDKPKDKVETTDKIDKDFDFEAIQEQNKKRQEKLAKDRSKDNNKVKRDYRLTDKPKK